MDLNTVKNHPSLIVVVDAVVSCIHSHNNINLGIARYIYTKQKHETHLLVRNFSLLLVGFYKHT